MKCNGTNRVRIGMFALTNYENPRLFLQSEPPSYYFFEVLVVPEEH